MDETLRRWRTRYEIPEEAFGSLQRILDPFGRSSSEYDISLGYVTDPILTSATWTCPDLFPTMETSPPVQPSTASASSGNFFEHLQLNFIHQ